MKKNLLTKKLKLAYFGAPEFSARFLEKLLTDKQLPIEIKLVVTQPDKPVGRKQILTPSPVKVTAQNHKIKTYEIFPAKTANYRLLTHLFYELKIDAVIVYGYGGIIPAYLLQSVRIGFFNLHPSLLPKLRGPSPIPYSIFFTFNDVYNYTGITLFKMDEKIDHGPIIIQKKMQILPTDKKPDLEIKLTNLAFEMLKKILIKLILTDFNRFRLIKQDEKQATYTRRLKKEDGFIPFGVLKATLENKIPNERSVKIKFIPKIITDFQQKNPNHSIANCQLPNSPIIIFNYFRGLYPWPGIWTKVKINGQEKRLKITDINLVGDTNLHPLQIIKVQLEGKKEVDFTTFNRVYKLFKL
ncbi:MAG: hypothetical protein ACD_12C00323G0002 [uncultured bacterium]|nr:MAG: hypothetical protein ACD_12C00323G0002 [uncultured bacterium]